MRHTEGKLIEPISHLSDPYVHFIPKKKKKNMQEMNEGYAEKDLEQNGKIEVTG